VKLPIRAISDALAQLNVQRGEGDQLRLAVDGVHGLASEDTRLQELGCDFFISGCHKWLFGPRGTGILWAKAAAWKDAQPAIPHFGYHAFEVWEGNLPSYDFPMSQLMTPGGFHTFEYRWALSDAFRFHQSLDKAKVAARIHALNRQFKEGARSIRGVRLRTPMSEGLSSGINCFEVEGLTAEQVVERLGKRRLVASVTPYKTRYVRASFGILNSSEDVDTTLREVRALLG